MIINIYVPPDIYASPLLYSFGDECNYYYYLWIDLVSGVHAKGLTYKSDIMNFHEYEKHHIDLSAIYTDPYYELFDSMDDDKLFIYGRIQKDKGKKTLSIMMAAGDEYYKFYLYGKVIAQKKDSPHIMGMRDENINSNLQPNEKAIYLGKLSELVSDYYEVNYEAN